MINLNDFLIDGPVAVTYRNGLRTTGLVKLNITKNDATKADYPYIFVPSDTSFAPLSYTVEGHHVVGQARDWDIVEITYPLAYKSPLNVQMQQEPNSHLKSVALVLTPAVVEALGKDAEFQSLLSSQVEKVLNELMPNAFQELAVKNISNLVVSKITLASVR
jgi:hypothetical protein